MSYQAYKLLDEPRNKTPSPNSSLREGRGEGSRLYLYAVGWGLCALTATFIKGAYQLISPVYMLTFLFFCLWVWARDNTLHQKWKRAVIFVLISLTTFLVPLTAYRWVNLQLNGFFTLTDRMSWALYGQSAHRAQEPISFERLKGAFLSVPGAGFCRKFLDEAACEEWTYVPLDDLGAQRRHALFQQGMNSSILDNTLIKEGLALILKHPADYFPLYAIEGLKIFFWEGYEAMFLTWPPVVEKLFSPVWIKELLFWAGALLTVWGLLHALVWLWRNKAPQIQDRKEERTMVTLMVLFIVLFTGCHCFFLILPRYVLTIAPLYLLLFAHSLKK